MGTNMGGKDSKRALIRTGTRRLARLGKDRRGEGYVDMIVLVLCAVLVLALAVRCCRYISPSSGWIPLPQNWYGKRR